MKPPEYKPEVKLTGRNGNAFLIMRYSSKALQQAGADEEYIEKYKEEAMSGDYDHLLQITMRYVDVA